MDQTVYNAALVIRDGASLLDDQVESVSDVNSDLSTGARFTMTVNGQRYRVTVEETD